MAHNFSAEMLPDSIGGDLVKWEYEPANALCNFYDAGALQDGAFPPDVGFRRPADHARVGAGRLRGGSMRAAARALAVAAATLAVACVTVAPPRGSPAPRNTCSTSLDCAKYTQTGTAPICTGGICNTIVPVTEWTAVVTLSQDAAYAAGSTFAVSYSDLFKFPVAACADACPANEQCVQLPQLATPVSPQNGQDAFDVEVNQQAASSANWNVGTAAYTALPVIPVLRPQAQAGLPLEPIQISETLNMGADAVRGPGGGPGFEFSVAVPPGDYEQTLMPVPPFDQAFPPDVRIIHLGSTPYDEQSVLFGCDPAVPGADPRCIKFDPITGPTGTTTHPSFDLSRADGGALDGWVAYLRDQTTLRPISNQVPLHGTEQPTVQLLTSHHPASGNAFDNAALVMQPPESSGLPTWIFQAVNLQLPAMETYPQLPAAVQVSGKIVAQSSGSPVPADVVFDTTNAQSGICRVPTGQTVPEFDASSNGDLTFSQLVSAPDGTFTVTLPQGSYRATVRPRDATAAVTVVPNFATVSTDASQNCLGPVVPAPITVGPLQTVRGKAVVGDLRPLAAATIEAVPTGCVGPPSDPTCLPRWGQTTTLDDGSYAISLDPGVYLLRARPAEGSALPWTIANLTVGSASVTPGPDIVVRPPSMAGWCSRTSTATPSSRGSCACTRRPPRGPSR